LAIEADHLEQEKYQGELCQFALHQDHRGGKMSSGLGLDLRNYAESEARKLGLTRIFLETLAQQSGLMNAYQQNGFFLTGKLRILHSNKFENGKTSLVTSAKPLTLS
jgi:N-acetylglutamate synthase-like GNAT family acetyltransferase